MVYSFQEKIVAFLKYKFTLLKRSFLIFILCCLSHLTVCSQDSVIYRNDVILELSFSYPLIFSQNLEGIADIGFTVPTRLPFLKSKFRCFYNLKISQAKKAKNLFWTHSIGYGFERKLMQKKDANLLAMLAPTYSFWHGNSVFEHGLGLSSSIEYHKKLLIVSLGYELLGGGNITLDGVPLKLRGSVLKFGLGFHIK